MAGNAQILIMIPKITFHSFSKLLLRPYSRNLSSKKERAEQRAMRTGRQANDVVVDMMIKYKLHGL